MAERTEAQKIGARGAKWLISRIEDHPNWLSRAMGEDFGVDIEAELTKDGVRGEVIRIQVKTSVKVKRNDGHIRLKINRKYLEIADASRYPVVVVLVDLNASEAWYLWLQDWLMKRRGAVRFSSKKKSWTEWVPETKTIGGGLDDELQQIARWQGTTQLVLSLLDAWRAANYVDDNDTAGAIEDILETNRELLAGSRLVGVVDEMIGMGDRMRQGPEGNKATRILFDLLRRYGEDLSKENIRELVMREFIDDAGDRAEGPSRTGVDGLSVLYDTFPHQLRAMGLPKIFKPLDLGVAYFCAWREAFPDESKGFGTNPGDFEFAGLRFDQSDRFADHEANRGKSAILDHLVPA